MALDSIRKRTSFAPQKKVEWKDLGGEDIQNWIHRAKKSDEEWIQETTEQIGAWRDMSRSVYLRWALTINAMHVSSDYYSDFTGDQRLQTETLRVEKGSPMRVPLAVWTGTEASDRYQEASEMIAAYGFADMYGVIEDITFEAHEIFLRHNPQSLIKGAEYKDVRRKFGRRAEHPDAWQEAWSKRYEDWRRKKLYDGLPKVAKSYWSTAGLRKPSTFEHTEINDWMASIKMFGVLRNHITHSSPNVTSELSEACNITGNMDFSFPEGEPIKVELYHLMAIECFVDQYLSALNMSLLELVYGHGHWAKLAEKFV